MDADSYAGVIRTDDPKLTTLLSSAFGLHQLIMSFPDYVSCLDHDLKIVFVNRISDGIRGQEVLGVDSRLFVPPHARDEYVQLARGVLERGETVTFDYESPTTGLTYQSRMAPLHGTDGEVLGIVATTTDVTEHRAAMRRIDEALALEREATQQLRRLDALKNEFVAKVAHDLRTPITTVQGFSDTMAWRWDEISDEDKLRYLQLISEGSQRLMGLVEDILEVSNLENAEFSVDIVELDLRRSVDMLSEHFAAVATPGRISWTTEPDLPSVLGDEQRIAQIVTNLVSNALKFSEPDTTVRFVAARHEDVVRITVTDEGIGIARQDVPRLFEKFIQLNQHPDRAGVPGSGLGLYITRSLVDAHDGRVWIESELGVGTSVIVELPIADD